MFEAYKVATRIEAIDATGGTILRIAAQFTKANREAGGFLATLKAINAELGKTAKGWGAAAADDFAKATRAAREYNRETSRGMSSSGGGYGGGVVGGMALAAGFSGGGGRGRSPVGMLPGYGGGSTPLRLSGPSMGGGGAMGGAGGGGGGGSMSWPLSAGGAGGGGGSAAMLGAGKMIAGGQLSHYGEAGMSMLAAPVDAAIDQEQATNRLRALNLGAGATNGLLANAKRLSETTKGLTYTDAIRLTTETQGITANVEHTNELLPGLAKMRFGISAYMGDGHGEAAEGQFRDVVKVMEMRGLMRDFTEDKAKGLEDLFTKSYVASGGQVDPTQFLNMMKTGGTAMKSVNTDFMYAMGHVAQEMGGARTGTAVMSGYQNLVAGRSTQQVAEELNKLGLLDHDALRYGKTGHLTKITPGALKDTEGFIANPLDYLEKNILPAIAAKNNIDVDDPKNTGKINMLINSMFSNRTASNMMTTLVQERNQIHAYTKQAKNVMGVDELAKQGESSTYGNLLEYHKQVNDMQSTLGKDILPMLNKGLKELVPLMRDLTNFMSENSGFMKGAIILFAGISAIATVSGAIVSIGGAFTMMSGLFAAGGLATGAAGLGAALAGLALPIAAIAAAAVAVGAAYEFSDKHLGGTKTGDWIGNATARTLAFFGNDEAQQAVDRMDKYDSLTNGPSYGNAGAGKVTQITTNLHMDGRKVGQSVTEYQHGQMTKPQSGTSYLDTSRGAQPIGYTGRN